MSQSYKIKNPIQNIGINYIDATAVLDNKLKDILKEAEQFLKDDTTKNLHSLRISFRKFRYVFEIFQNCFDPKLYDYIYKYVKEMQDLIGKCRDFDMLKIISRKIEKGIDKKLPKRFYSKINQEKREIRETIKEELIKFIVDKEVNKLIILKKRG